MKVALIIPTRNAGKLWSSCLDSIRNQSVSFESITIIDSCSSDDTVVKAQQLTSDIISIDPKDFNHGGTRNIAFRHVTSNIPDIDILIFLTQDAIFDSPNAVANLLGHFKDKKVGAVCGRQLPHYDANPLSIHARNFNYPDISSIKSQEDIPCYGLKVAFMSNSFAAYRREVFEALGGFPENTILAEDMFLAAKMVLASYKVSYCAEATVRHSHNYTPWDEFRRYFDTGVFHACEPWIQKSLGGASGEGFRFVKSELSYLLYNAPLWIPRALLTTACKLIGYKLGKNFNFLPLVLRSKFSMYRSYWLQESK